VKTLIGLLLAVAVNPSFAVVTKNCPDQVQFSFDRFKVISAAELKKKLSIADNEDGIYEHVREEIARRSGADVSLKLRPTPEHSRKSICLYASDENDRASARFYTASGKDIFRVDYVTDEDTRVGFYVTVSDYSSSSLSAAHTAGIAYEADGSDSNFNAFFLGRADVTVK
jgi:hypothetical protein